MVQCDDSQLLVVELQEAKVLPHLVGNHGKRKDTL